MYALSVSAEGDYYLCVPRDPGIEAAALGASDTTLTPLSAPVLVRLADPSGDPVLDRSSTVLQCPAVPSGSLSGLHLPLFPTNLVSTAALQDAMVTTTTPGGSSLYTLATEPPQVAASAQVSTSDQVAPPCSCRLLSRQTLLWHHRLGHPSLPRLQGMHSRLLVSGLPRSLPPLLPSPAPPCLLCVEGRQRAAPHSSSFSLDDCSPVDSPHGLVGPSPHRLQLCERFREDLPVLRLHSDRGGEFSFDILWDFFHGEGILQLFMIPDSPQKNGVVERRIGLVMEFYHPTSRRVLPSQDVTFDESVPFYHPLLGTAPIEVAVGSGATRGAVSGGTASGGAEPGDAESEGAGSGGAEPGGVEPGGVEPEGVEPGGAESEGVESGVLKRGRTRLRSGAAGAVDTGAGGARVTTGAGGTGGAAADGPEGARTRGTGAAGTGGVGGAGARCTGAGGTGAGGTGAGRAGAIDPGAGGIVRPPAVLQSVVTASRPASPICTSRRVPHPHPPPVPSTHAMALRPSSLPLRVPLLPPLVSSLPTVPDPESDRARATSPTVSRLLAIVLTDPFFESTPTSALVAELVDFAVVCRLDYATALVAESDSASPLSVGGECALCTDVLEDRQEDFECLAAAVPRFASMLLAPEGDPDAPDIPTPRSYAEAITVSESGLGFEFLCVHFGHPSVGGVSEHDYELHSLDFSTAFLQGSLHEEIWLRCPPGFTGSFPAGTQWSLRRPLYGLRQAPRKWHDTLWTTLAALGFAPSTADPSLFLRTDTSLPPLYVLVYITWDRARRTMTLTQSQMVHQVLQRFGFQFSSPQPTPLSTGHLLSAPPSDESVEPSGPYPELVVRRAWGLCLEDGVQLSSLDTQTFLGSSCEAEIYAGVMAAHELPWLTYLTGALNEAHRSRYFLARELQQRGQLRLAYMATRANTADIFTKALPPGDHQCFSTVLGLVPNLPHLLTA
ncbi:unnamed protein product [Closterium sp. NIES-53]